MIGSSESSRKRLSYGVFPSDTDILNVSQISIAFHGLCPPCFIQTCLQHYRRGTFFHSAYCSQQSHFPRFVWRRRTMIPGKIFTSLAKFQGIVILNDFRLPIRLQELLHARLRFLWSFCSTRIRLDPLGHHDCISVLVSRFTTFTENFVMGCNQITKFFCTKYDSAIASSARGPCEVGPVADLAISVFREGSINTVFTQIHTSQKLER